MDYDDIYAMSNYMYHDHNNLDKYITTTDLSDYEYDMLADIRDDLITCWRMLVDLLELFRD